MPENTHTHTHKYDSGEQVRDLWASVACACDASGQGRKERDPVAVQTEVERGGTRDTGCAPCTENPSEAKAGEQDDRASSFAGPWGGGSRRKENACEL